jgi:hypothetical protein
MTNCTVKSITFRQMIEAETTLIGLTKDQTTEYEVLSFAEEDPMIQL